MTLNLPSLYFSDYKSMARPAQIKTNSPKNQSPNLWHVTSILVCCIFASEYHSSVSLLQFVQVLLTQTLWYGKNWNGKEIYLKIQNTVFNWEIFCHLSVTFFGKRKIVSTHYLKEGNGKWKDFSRILSNI